MKLKGAKSVHYESGPNMTPLVDVVMVILIFLMLAGSFVENEHYLQTNQATTGGAGPASHWTPGDDPIEIQLDAHVPDRFSARVGKFRSTNPASLTADLQTMRTQMKAIGMDLGKLRVVIAPSRWVKYRFLLEAYEAALNAEYQNISFARAHD
jgi:biopolymer transport protein ExbD